MFEYRGVTPDITFDDEGNYLILSGFYSIFVQEPELERSLQEFKCQVDDYYNKEETTH